MKVGPVLDSLLESTPGDGSLKEAEVSSSTRKGAYSKGRRKAEGRRRKEEGGRKKMEADHRKNGKIK